MSSFPKSAAGWKIRILLGSLALDKRSVRIGKILSLLIIICFSIGASYFFHTIFSSMLKYEGIGEPLLWRVISITIVTVFGLLVISNLITGIATLYRSPEIPFHFARPVSAGRIFMNRFTDNLVYSSWSLAVLGVPIILAWGLVFDLSIWIIVGLVIFGLIPLVLISAQIGSAILMGMIFLARKISPRITIFLFTVIVIAVIGWAVYQRSSGLIADGIPRMSRVERYLTQLSSQSDTDITPAHWLAGAMLYTIKGDHRRAWLLTVLLSLTALIWMRWLYLLADRVYYNSWIAFNEVSGRAGKASPRKSARRFSQGILPNPLNAMLLKDILQFKRNSNQWAQFLILLAFLLIYLFNLLYISSRFDINDPQWKTLVLFLNFAFSGFILATLSVRFVFPLISLEGNGFWIIRSAPVSIGKLFWEKFFLAFIVFMGLCELIVYVSNHALHVSQTMMILTTSTTFMMGATLTGLAIGMGALMPDFSDESPMRIASTPGGVLTVVISLVYVGLMVTVLAYPTRSYFIYLTGHGPFPAAEALLALGIMIGLNLLVFSVPLRLGRLAIKMNDL